jgi:predicted PurR-regulated permease PerM
MHSQPVPPPPPANPLRAYSGGLVNGTLVMVLLYFGREVLVPITLAVILSLLVAPLVRALRRRGLGQVGSVLGAVFSLTFCVLGLAAVIGTQMVSMAGSLPQYESTIRSKIKVAQELATGRMELMQGEAGRMMSRLGDAEPEASRVAGLAGLQVTASGALPVEIHERPRTPVEMMSRTFSQIWGPLGRAGIVLVILVFVLLEHESLRDRFIRLVGGTDLRRTTHAFNDAGERLSRFFVSQFAVNVGVGVVVGVGLALAGLPHALLWAVLTAVLRFVPYVGVFVAAFSAALLAAAVDPGWSLMLVTLGLFGVVELLAAQVIEPQLYGHSTGLSPLSVVLAAIFWDWIWGPIGLLVSTPLTLCLVVAGRHIQGLAFLDILLGDTPALSMSERFYQRALSGDADEIVAAAKVYLKRKSFARYCDKILMPALQLAMADLGKHSISLEQQGMVKGTIARVVEALGPDVRKGSRKRRRSVSVLDDEGLGAQLRHQREAVIGKFQGPLDMPPGSVVLCIGLGSLRDDFVTELLVRILRDLDFDARHLSVEDTRNAPPPGAHVNAVAMVCLVSAFPADEWARATELMPTLRSRYTSAVVVGLVPEGAPEVDDESVDIFLHSFEETAEHVKTLFGRAEEAGQAPKAAKAAA